MITFIDMGKPYAVLLLRLVIAWRLLAGTWPYVSNDKPIQEIITFFQSLSLPYPVVSAYVSLYAQFICGILLLLGGYTRGAALILVVNFSVALLVAHLHDPIESSFQAWALWVTAIYFFFHGAGFFSSDKLIEWTRIKSFDIKINDM